MKSMLLDHSEIRTETTLKKKSPNIWKLKEAEAGKSPEPGDRGYREPRSRHCTPAWPQSKTLSFLKKKKELET